MLPPKDEANVSARADGTTPENVIVAVKAQKVISKTAFAWALSHVVHPGDCITLLAVYSGQKTGKSVSHKLIGRKLWSSPIMKGDCRNGDGKLPDRIYQISESCSRMVLEFHDQIEVVVRIKVVSVAPAGAVAAEAKSKAANWVILDKKLKKERNHCMEELRCNIVVMKGSQPNVLRLSLKCPNEIQTPFFSAASSPGLDAEVSQGHRMKHSTPIGSPEEPSTSFTLSSEEKSLSSFGLDTVTPLFFVYEQNPLFEGLNRGRHTPTDRQNGLVDPITALGSSGERIITLSITPKVQSDHKRVFWIPETHAVDGKSRATKNSKNTPKMKPFVQCNQDILTVVPKVNQSHERDHIFSSSIREAVSLGRTSSIPPPLCSLCQHKAPAFGKPPRQFAYQELEEATDEFSDMNFLAEGGFGLVHRGVLKDGQVVAVKQLKFAGSKGDADFCREMRVLSYAQHRNVVLLIGFCIERKKRVLVYEFICNGNERTPLDWPSRLKIATGTARGLRYLHEDCRVGDFGLVKLHNEWDFCDEERVVGTSGY
ncbi:hypothetical protein RJ640_020353 [Escallonia rubra]|uniref:Protein kinase domain-containing protein n=1 Tax=Escallonia rubra TaxID=112253 RepID=A0AA88QU93_9ASTE|nr:hypothetical protein RJ640_020353 [Escallonia rubra]